MKAANLKVMVTAAACSCLAWGLSTTGALAEPQRTAVSPVVETIILKSDHNDRGQCLRWSRVDRSAIHSGVRSDLSGSYMLSATVKYQCDSPASVEICIERVLYEPSVPSSRFSCGMTYLAKDKSTDGFEEWSSGRVVVRACEHVGKACGRAVWEMVPAR